ncbi:sugar ABC transporter ATP-binding protein [Microvirga lotononidis]|uniref:ABC-type sugar transport system, ATPase component n=1 Tax=Microvirga lotononidis TaxID=864069 RepID=I4YNZ2_9HYPH|nr:sugar ABC transporter ATP-binding protein [Microvirga lotononidis]EIM25684.1 ABC-type sugar transport system, ATPase component [Microvirga lotononidis]WQO25623.1 sugar ABC transporter ATP-binding protein [Microvirga lotononidis]
MAPLLTMHGIDKRFAGIPALRAADLVVEKGEVHALIGQNGAGKSTMIKILTGYYRKDAGEILFDGSAVEFSSPQEAQKAGISTIYQEINLVPYRSVTENICLGREKHRFGLLDWPAMHAEARALLARFSIDIDVHRPLMVYPTAVQQMVAIARAIGFEAKLVIMDEPTSSLDEREVGVLFGVIRQLKAAGVSVIFVSHKLDELYAVCDRVTIMRDGRTVQVAPMSQLSRLDLVTSMLGRELTQILQEPHDAGTSEADTRTPVLTVRGLAVGRKVRDVSFEVRPGEIVGLAGLLGAGRTESVRAVYGADRPDSGTITFAGRDNAIASPSDAILAGMGFCSEDRKLEGIIPDMSVRENLTLALMPQLARNGIVDEARSREIVDRFIKRLGIRCSGPEQRIRELSGGNQQKVLLARWLCMNPKLLILDEPTRGIDVGAKAEILSLIRELAGQGLGVLMISSELEEVVDAASRIFVLRDGHTAAELEGDSVTEQNVMAAMAHGHESAREAPHG